MGEADRLQPLSDPAHALHDDLLHLAPAQEQHPHNSQVHPLTVFGRDLPIHARRDV